MTLPNELSVFRVALIHFCALPDAVLHVVVAVVVHRNPIVFRTFIVEGGCQHGCEGVVALDDGGIVGSCFYFLFVTLIMCPSAIALERISEVIRTLIRVA